MTGSPSYPGTEEAKRILENQVEIIWTLHYLLECAKPELVGRAGALDRMRGDLVHAAKTTKNLLEGRS
jgi:hypothetical protein